MANKADSYINLAQQQRNQGNSKAAIETIKQALNIDPNDAYSHAFLAICCLDEYVDQNEEKFYLVEALQAGHQALNVDPDDPFSHYVLSMVYLNKSAHMMLAEEHINQALAIEPENATYVTALADIYARQERTKLAMQTYEKALSFDPENIETLTSVAHHYFFDKGDVKNAKIRAEQALSIEPQFEKAHLIMGHISYKEGNIEAAKEHIGISLSHNPNDFPTLFLLCALEKHKNIFLKQFFHLMMWMFQSSNRIGILVFGVIGLCIGLSMLPEEMGVIKRDWLGWILLAVSLYVLFFPIMFVEKVKRKYMKQQVLSDDF